MRRGSTSARIAFFDAECFWRNCVSVSVGGPAVPFRLKDTSGALHRLEDYTGKWLVLVFHRHLR